MKGKLITIGISLAIITVLFVGIVDNVKAVSALREERKAAEASEEIEPILIVVEEPVEVAPKVVYFDVPLSHEVQDTIFAECEKKGISPAVVVGLIERESRFNTYALGDDGRSFGLMQIQAKWHLQRMIDLSCTDLLNPSQNVTVGIDYLAELQNRYGDIEKALTAYNRGSYSCTITEYAKDVAARAARLGGDSNVLDG